MLVGKCQREREREGDMGVGVGQKIKVALVSALEDGRWQCEDLGSA